MFRDILKSCISSYLVFFRSFIYLFIFKVINLFRGKF